MRARTIAALAVSAMVALAGCGGTDHKPDSAVQVGQVGSAPRTLVAQRRHGRRVHHATHKAKRHAVHQAAKPLVAHGGTAEFVATATGRPHALKALAASIPGAAVPGHSAAASRPHFTHVGGAEATFIAAADSICTSYRTTVRGIAAKATTLPAQESEMQDLVNATSASLKQLEGLSPPASLASAAGSYISLVGQSVSHFVLAQQRSTSGSEAVGVANESADMNDANASAHEAENAVSTAQHIGFHVCGSAGAEWL